MKICSVVSCTLGSAIGGVLSEEGADVTLIDQRRGHFDAMLRHVLAAAR